MFFIVKPVTQLGSKGSRLSGFQNGSSICLDSVDSAFTLLRAKCATLDEKTSGAATSGLS